MIKNIFVILFISQIVVSCSANKQNTVYPSKKVNSQVVQYLPERIYVQHPIISGGKHSITVKDINIGFPLRFHAPIVVADYKITPTKNAFIKFRNKIDTLKIWDWKNKYYSNRTEGWTNRVILKYPDKEINVEIVSKNPKNYDKFIKALLELVQYDKNSLNNKEFMKRLKSLKSK